MLARRRALAAGDRRDRSGAIATRLYELEAWTAATTVHAYIGAVDGEVETRPIVARALAAGKRVVCPRVEWPGRRLRHFAIDRLDGLVESERGLWEPPGDSTTAVDPAELDLVLVPGLAFDRFGGRVGFGAGFYDRFLAATTAWRIALAYSLQIIERVPTEDHDQAVDRIVTEIEDIDCRAMREVRS